jgi:ATP-binding cassette subfamily F protein uup
VFLVSHDRAFLDNVVTQTIASEGDGRWKEYAGGYSDWQRVQPAQTIEPASEKRAAKAETKPKRAASAPAKAGLSYKEARELAELPARIDALEREQALLSAALADAALYREQPEKVKQLNARYAALEAELAAAFARWEELEAKR